MWSAEVAGYGGRLLERVPQFILAVRGLVLELLRCVLECRGGSVRACQVSRSSPRARHCSANA